MSELNGIFSDVGWILPYIWYVILLLCPFSSPKVNKHIKLSTSSVSTEINMLFTSLSADLALTKLSMSSLFNSNVASHSGSFTVPTLPISNGSANAYVKLNDVSDIWSLVGLLLCFSTSSKRSP